ncbi:MAG: hypothetical protein GXX96_05270 [Planctomycetaceae bacterium]|nr:hypothetical protein [Planctomycetaceae bacterium]
MAGPFSYDSFIRYSGPVHPGDFPDRFIRPIVNHSPLVNSRNATVGVAEGREKIRKA